MSVRIVLSENRVDGVGADGVVRYEHRVHELVQDVGIQDF
jgi:hypothetical protein